MSDTVIKVENLFKEYRLGVIGYGTLKEDIQSWFARIRKKEDPNYKIDFESSNQVIDGINHIYALNNLSFEVKQGEVLGLIGKNGAGKSTLLKILSRITAPTKGAVKIKGRIGSLLEVGTGFHQELTGKENIYLNGAILGMKKKEISRKLDEIVDFSGVEKFIDTPVKRYSSGMKVRLAFAVAAHLDPEILLVDEVLAVGDIEFQNKCLGKMGDVASEGRTILFVSHNMAAIKRLCTRGILLHNGEMVDDGKTDDIVEKYLNMVEQNVNTLILADREDRRGNGVIRFTSVVLQNQNDEITDKFYCGEKIKFIINFENRDSIKLKKLHININICNYDGTKVAYLGNDVSNRIFKTISPKNNKIILEIDKLMLNHGKYSFILFSRVNGEIADWVRNAGYFKVEYKDYYGTSKLPNIGEGELLLDYSYNIL